MLNNAVFHYNYSVCHSHSFRLVMGYINKCCFKPFMKQCNLRAHLGAKLCVLVDDITVPLPLRMQENENVKKYVGKPIVYGIRCEDMHINSSYALENKQNEITLKADLAEMMGSEVYIYSSINDKEIIAKVRSDTNISSGDSVKLYIDTEKVHLFDPESELLICD